MSPRVVYLHIGSSKTGTTFVQEVLWANREILLRNGVHFPSRRRMAGQAATALLEWDPASTPEVPAAWHELTSELMESKCHSAVISQEYLCWLSTEQINAMLKPLSPAQIKVVLTARDLGRLIPAQWQSAMRQRNTWTLTRYAKGLAGQTEKGTNHPAYRHFWKRQDYGSILHRWADIVGTDHVALITVPPSGSGPDELWRRFCQATDLNPQDFETAGVSNASLGAASAEILRRVNATSAVQEMPREQYAGEINGFLSRRVLDVRAPQEPKLSLPRAQRSWVGPKAEEIISEIKAIGCPVIGSLEDLRPRPSDTPYRAPEKIADAELLAAAVDGLAGLAVEHAKPKERAPRRRSLVSAVLRRLRPHRASH